MELWKNQLFRRFFASFVMGNLGDWIDIFALQIIFVHVWHATPNIMGFMLLMMFLPSILFGPFIGVLVDRLSRRNVMLVTDFISGLLTIGLLFSPSIAVGLILLFVRSCFATTNGPAQQAYIKHVVSDSQLLAASSYTSIVFQSCKVLGPFLGAVLLIFISPKVCLALNAVSFFISTLILLSLPYDPIHQAESIEGEVEAKAKKWWRNLIEGAQVVWQTSVLRNLIFFVFIWFLLSLIRQAQLAIYLRHLLPNEPNALGYAMAADGFGAVASGTWMSRRTRIRSVQGYFFCGFLLLALGVFVVGLYQNTWPQGIFFLGMFIVGLGSGINIVLYSYLQKQKSPSDKVGRVTSLCSMVQGLGLAIGSVSSGFLVSFFGLREVYLGLAIAFTFLALASLSLLKESTQVTS